jgi:hypothetical protein
VQRWLFEAEYGPLPLGQVIWAACGNKRCVNPDHAAYGTRRRYGHLRAALPKKVQEEICNLYASGLYSQTELGAEFGLAQSAISRIVNGKYPVTEEPPWTKKSSAS